MGEWPEGWFRDRSAEGEPGAGDKTVGIQHGGADDMDGTAAGQYQVRHYSPGAGGGSAPPGGWPEQPPTESPFGTSWRSRFGGGGGSGWRRWTRPRRIFAILGVLILLLIIGTASTYLYLNSKLHRSNILVDYAGRPAPGSGTNWLITGSPAAQGLTLAQEYRLSLGNDPSDGTDTIMILHMPANGGRPLLISIPRDSYVNVPGHGWNKIDAAFAYGGPKLLAETVQNATGVYINHFMDIGYGGFVSVVNDVGGVRMCLPSALRDVASGVNLKKGCHNLDGGQALAYVRDRHNFVTQDLQREQDQRLFLKALLDKMTSTGVMLNPFKILPAASSAAGTLTVDNGTSLYDLYGVAQAMRNPLTTTVPIANANYFTPAGDAVQWASQQAKELFTDLQTGKAVPKSLITGSHIGP